MNKNKIFNTIILLLIIFSTIVVGYYVYKNFKQELEKRNFTYILSENNMSNWNVIYSIFYDSLEYTNELNVSHAPYEQFCNDVGMKYFSGDIFQSVDTHSSKIKQHMIF